MRPDRPAVCFVVQRYGRDVVGGAETLCREVAGRLSGEYRLTILTTCALDYITWKNHFPPGEFKEGETSVIRFPVEKPRRVRSFGRLSARLYRKPHRLSEEVEWMEKQGPDAPGIIRHIRDRAGDFDLFVFFTYLYPPTFFGLPWVAEKAVLAPMAHPEEPLALDIFRYLFHLPRGFLFNTPEERDLVYGTFNCRDIPGAVAGIGLDPPDPSAAAPPAGADSPYLLYLGRIDVQKGLDELFDFYRRYRSERPGREPRLLLAGSLKMKLPSIAGLTYLGYIPEHGKEEAILGAAGVAVPSPHESLSITALEAWSYGRPVLANGRSEVLAGQCRRSGGGLTYASYEEFRDALDRLLGSPELGRRLGALGRDHILGEYSWDKVKARYVQFLDGMIAAVRQAHGPS